MDGMSISKSDLKYLFLFASLVPILSFMMGFYIAKSTVGEAAALKSDKATALVKQDITKLDPANKLVTEAPVLIGSPVAFCPEVTGKAEVVAKRYILQAGLFSTVENARKQTKFLIQSGLVPQIVSESINGANLFRVILGSHDSEETAKARAETIQQTYAIKIYVSDTSAVVLNDLVAAL